MKINQRNDADANHPGIFEGLFTVVPAYLDLLAGRRSLRSKALVMQDSTSLSMHVKVPKKAVQTYISSEHMEGCRNNSSFTEVDAYH
jgi:hypothetical protein